MKTILTLLLLLTISYQKPIKLGSGYLVSITTKDNHVRRKLNDIEIVENLVSFYFPEPVNVENLLFNSDYFDIKSDRIYVYVQKGRLIKKNGRIKFRKLK